MKRAYIAINIILAAIFIFIIIKSGCNSPVQDSKIITKKYEVIKYVLDTQYIEKKITIIKKGKDIYRDTTIYQQVPYLDSVKMQEIIKQYYAKSVSNDTIKVDSGYVYINDTIQMNQILNRILTLDIKYPVITKSVFYKENKKIQVYLGAKGMVSQFGNFQSAGVGLMLKTKSDRMYGIGAGFDSKRNLNITADLYIKL